MAILSTNLISIFQILGMDLPILNQARGQNLNCENNEGYVSKGNVVLEVVPGYG